MRTDSSTSARSTSATRGAPEHHDGHGTGHGEHGATHGGGHGDHAAMFRDPVVDDDTFADRLCALPRHRRRLLAFAHESLWTVATADADDDRDPAG